MEIREYVKNEWFVISSYVHKGFSGHVQVHHIFLDFYYIPDNGDVFFILFTITVHVHTRMCVGVPAGGWGQRTILWCLLHPPLCRLLGSPRCVPFPWRHLANPDPAQLSADSEREKCSVQ